MARKPSIGPEAQPFLPPAYDIGTAGAFQALARGEAMPHQQQAALKYVIETLAGAYDLSFRPGPDGSRLTDLAEGRRFVGLQIVKLLNLDLNQLKKADPNG